MILTETNRIKIERLKEFPQLKKEIVSYLFDAMGRKPQNQWHNYKGEFRYDGQAYDLECDCKLDNQIFSFKNMHISYKQQVIDIDDWVRKGMLQ